MSSSHVAAFEFAHEFGLRITIIWVRRLLRRHLIWKSTMNFLIFEFTIWFIVMACHTILMWLKSTVQSQCICITQVESSLSASSTHQTMYIISIIGSWVAKHASTCQSLSHLLHQSLYHIDICDLAVVEIVFYFLQVFLWQALIWLVGWNLWNEAVFLASLYFLMHEDAIFVSIHAKAELVVYAGHWLLEIVELLHLLQLFERQLLHEYWLDWLRCLNQRRSMSWRRYLLLKLLLVQLVLLLCCSLRRLDFSFFFGFWFRLLCGVLLRACALFCGHLLGTFLGWILGWLCGLLHLLDFKNLLLVLEDWSWDLFWDE